ncbi:MAG: response regulator transcription factor [Lawsonibacter sp.]|nr:response regulator transcription factor [Lawsonibacter sp.]
MIKFAICDDEPRMSQDLAARLAGYMEERQITAYSVSRFSGGDALLEWSGRFDVIFLDIQMDPPDGMETARLLRRRGDHSLLVFVTVLKELVFDAFDVEACGYLVKPLDRAAFRRTMDRVLRSLERRTARDLLIQRGAGCEVVPLDRIVYCEVLGRKIYLHQNDGRVGRLLRIGGQKTESGELVNGGILEQAQLRVSNAAAGNDLHIHLDPFSWTSHLLVRFWRISLFLLLLWEHPQFAHDSEQTLRPAGVAALFQAVPQLHQAKLRIAAAHVPDQLQLRFGMPVWMTVRTPGLAGQGLHAPIPASTPEKDIGPALVVLPAGPADTIFLRIFH